MTIKRKGSKAIKLVQMDIEDKIGEVINRGGKTANDDTHSITALQEPQKEEVRFTLRIPYALIDKIDKARKSRVGNVSRNQWIVEAINKFIE